MRVEPELVGGVLAPAFAALFALVSLPHLVPVLSHFDSLPLISRVVLATYQWWLLVPVVIGGLLAATRWHRTHPQRVARAGIAVALSFVVFAVVGGYAPIFALAYGVPG